MTYLHDHMAVLFIRQWISQWRSFPLDTVPDQPCAFLPPLMFLGCPTVLAVRQSRNNATGCYIHHANVLCAWLQVSISRQYGQCALHRWSKSPCGLLKTYQLITPHSHLGDFRLSLEETKRLRSLHSGQRYMLPVYAAAVLHLLCLVCRPMDITTLYLDTTFCNPIATNLPSRVGNWWGAVCWQLACLFTMVCEGSASTFVAVGSVEGPRLETDRKVGMCCGDCEPLHYSTVHTHTHTHTHKVALRKP